jgi:hypothetical protein
MTPAALAKRLGEVEACLAELMPPAEEAPEWLAWATDAELTAMQLIVDRAPDGGLTEADQLRIVAIECAALTRMTAGEPNERDRDRGYREAR